ncbi:hypothetical protein AKJ51_05025 [candidate division MSBL1 archaeon SCGC-AAA382A20]|uniref:Short-chain dehydrogenase n=1 Tax=candidate division MSBL1 archaeon SCGC-AAA382A20 TaxID=1698280 RepID=A0A133VGA0_9EURY|nr:hypothetical protein AKJ51_05025 [candidate division MSBL1 archaeon SCGC-AAA382A20]
MTEGLLEGKVAIVTGASSGIGRATALRIAEEGGKVVVADVLADKGKETVEMVVENGGTGFFVETDVSDSEDVREMVRKTVDEYNRLDCAFNNAGIFGDMKPVAKYDEEDFSRILDVNIKGVFLCMKYEIQQMLEQDGGSIVNTSSVWGLVGGEDSSAYIASKHGVIGVTKAAALENADTNIRVNAVCPGVVETAMVEAIPDEISEALIAKEPIGRAGKPEEIAEAVVWLLSDRASFVTGETHVVDGGFTIS